ncbi:MAG: hypothetical protein WA110_03890 [Anaerolineaceae bacterium]
MTLRPKTNRKPIILIRLILICGLMLGVLNTAPVRSVPLPSQGPKRVVVLDVDYTTYEWWLLSWKTSQVVCQIYVEHESWPDTSEVLYYCGSQIQSQWLKTTACIYDDFIKNPQQCAGLYLHLANVTPSSRKVEVNLPPAEVYVSISGCDRQPPQNQCTSMPYLRLEAVEPLPNEQIIQILGTLNGEPFSCPGNICDLPLSPTGMDGVNATFWAESSYGDASEVFDAQVRVIPWGDFANPDAAPVDNPTYYVDVLSSQWTGEALSSCSTVWQAFTPVDGPPAWLYTPSLAEELVSVNEYYLLAGSLIKQGAVDASSCENGGLEENGAANVCGMELARPYVDEWQNQFDAEILRVAEESGVPAQLMKNIFSRESQFWPGIYNRFEEAGLGHLSDLGADTVLLWNPSFYDQFCPLVLSEETCQRGFGNLDEAQQEMLRGALVQKVNASCLDCPVGIDLTQANFSISIFARSLLANCEQVGQIVYNSSGLQAGQVASYEDLWRFTLLNYNAGSGCLSNAIQQAINYKQPLTWANVVQFLEPVCQAGIGYVDDISNMPVDPNLGVGELLTTPDPEIVLATPVRTPTPRPTATPTSVLTPGPTATQGSYPIGTPTPTEVYP